MHGSGKADIQIPPAHGFLERYVVDHAGENLGKKPDSGNTCFFFRHGDIFALFRRDNAEGGSINPLATGKTLARPGRCAVVVEGDLFRRSHGCYLRIGLLHSHRRHRQHQAAGRCHGLHLTESDTGVVQLFPDQGFHLGHSLGEEPGRDLFGADFQKQFFCH